MYRTTNEPTRVSELGKCQVEPHRCSPDRVKVRRSPAFMSRRRYVFIPAPELVIELRECETSQTGFIERVLESLSKVKGAFHH